MGIKVLKFRDGIVPDMRGAGEEEAVGDIRGLLGPDGLGPCFGHHKET